MNEDERLFIDNDLRITCADAVELVTEFLEETLSPTDRDNFETHLSLCEGCQAFLDQINKTITLTSRSATTTVDVLPANFDELLTALEELQDP
jgi:predicted anti-sigma-YlaC factor YlaD